MNLKFKNTNLIFITCSFGFSFLIRSNQFLRWFITKQFKNILLGFWIPVYTVKILLALDFFLVKRPLEKILKCLHKSRNPSPTICQLFFQNTFQHFHNFTSYIPMESIEL